MKKRRSKSPKGPKKFKKILKHNKDARALRVKELKELGNSPDTIKLSKNIKKPTYTGGSLNSLEFGDPVNDRNGFDPIHDYR